ncbi:Flagellar hook protein FlgE [Planctomycetes bacterium Poly30]|uniref:Flagellar hook protein FlgE n=1 Tax=Saltatorellus ferox TaxID=2528018 RepID=A0A518F0X2_9BACT|nr:Flagellar hook protein FlgE [Planctomycetes bacterium Poly30]
MSSSFYSALSGMRTHQQWIDVIGNNLANQNTPGYKKSRASFSDNFSQNFRFASAPNAGRGGINPMQVGYGVGLASIDKTFTQGSLTDTGRVFDLALEGGGFFALQTPENRTYSRVGTFGLDATQNLVDQASGAKVLDPNGVPINLDVTSLFPPQITTEVIVKGNLPAVVSGPLAESLSANSAYFVGTPAEKRSTSAAPSYNVAAVGGVPGDIVSMEVIANGGVPQQVVVPSDPVTGAIPAASIAAAINALQDITSYVDGASGEIVVETDRKGGSFSIDLNPPLGVGDLTQLVGFSTTLASGSETPIPSDLSTAELNGLTGNLTEYVDGDQIQVVGEDTDGMPISATFTFGAGNDGTTMADFVGFLNSYYTDAEVMVDGSGRLSVTAATAGEADLLLSITDDPANTGGTDWNGYAMSVATDGTGPDTVTTSTEVYDAAGVAHTVTLNYERQADLTWNLYAQIPDGTGTIAEGGVDDPITGIAFAPDGSPTGLGSVDNRLRMQFTGQPIQEVSVDLGLDGNVEGVTQFGSAGTAYVFDQNGYGDGELANIFVSTDGQIDGFYSNGQTRELGQLAVVTFQNDEGLRAAGNNMFEETPNSGEARFGEGDIRKAGAVISGSLENSNVDTAEQFVRLIEAQRGYQANARVVSAQDEVLSETVNLV